MKHMQRYLQLSAISSWNDMYSIPGHQWMESSLSVTFGSRTQHILSPSCTLLPSCKLDDLAFCLFLAFFILRASFGSSLVMPATASDAGIFSFSKYIYVLQDQLDLVLYSGKSKNYLLLWSLLLNWKFWTRVKKAIWQQVNHFKNGAGVKNYQNWPPSFFFKCF